MFPNREVWWAAALLGLAFDRLFWQQHLGLNFTLYALVCLGSGVGLLLRSQRKPSPGFLALVPAMVTAAAVVSIRREPLTVFLAVAATLILLAVGAQSYSGAASWRQGFLDLLSGALRFVESMIAHPKLFPSQQVHREASAAPRSWVAVGRGLLLAIPVILVFASLLVAADPVFAVRISFLAKILRPKLATDLVRLTPVTKGQTGVSEGVFSA